MYTYVIPISLFVTMELVRLGQGMHMASDAKMKFRNEAADGTVTFVPMRASNTSLNEDLGRVEYVFSDKTGTFTQNSMRMAKFFVLGTRFDEMETPGVLLSQVLTNDLVDPKLLKTTKLFCRALALCHGVIPSFDPKIQELIYESQSPDETALLQGVKRNGYTLLSRNKSKMTVEITGQEESFEILNVIEFDSARKRMSVIMRTPEGIHIYCKGADNIMFERLGPKNDPKVLEEATNALNEFSNVGLRTLVIGYRKLSEQEYLEFKKAYEGAEVALEGREVELSMASSMVECDFQLLGCTAIEDRLQDKLPETIEYLLNAEIKLWLLTGDKQETAINIGLSSRLINNDMELLILNGASPSQCEANMDEMLLQMKNEPEKIFALVVNGDVLKQVFDGANKQKFLAIGTNCRSVICTRVTPLQKALVVRLVKDNYPNSTTLAIGDGANDVSMIQEAHIGVGIMGKEGTQAVRASDYAFGEFRFLQRLLAVHGRYNYLRLSNLIYFCFYKNFVFILIQFFFGFHNAWTGQVHVLILAGL